MKNAETEQLENEFSYQINVSELPKSGLKLKLSADERERVALAERYKISAVKSLAAKLQVMVWRRGGLHVEGTLEAEVEQACVVTLEPVPDTISERFSVYFLPPGEEQDIMVGEISLDPDSVDEFDVLQGDSVDVGEIVAEQLAVALEPYPRKPGIDAEALLPQADDADEHTVPNPFAILKDMPVVKKDRDEKN